MSDLQEMAERGRRKARKYRKLAHEVDQRSGERVLAATTPSGKEVTGRPDELRRKFDKRAETWANLAAAADEIDEMAPMLDDIKERIAQLEAKQDIRRMTGASRNGHGRP